TIVLADVVEATEDEAAAAQVSNIAGANDADTAQFAAAQDEAKDEAQNEKSPVINPEAIMVGAIAGEVPEPTHPDSAASRAAALNRRPQVIEPYSGPSTSSGAPRTTVSPTGGNPTNPVDSDDSEGTADAEQADEEPGRRRKFFGWPLIVSILVIIALVAGVWWVGKNYLNNNYYVAVVETAANSDDAKAEPQEEIRIMQGIDMELFGRSLNKAYQVACLHEDGALQLAGNS